MMSKEIQSIFSFIGGCSVIWAIAFFGWKGLFAVGVMVALYYIVDVIMFVIFFIGTLIYLEFNKCRGVAVEESIRIINNKLDNKPKEQKK